MFRLFSLSALAVAGALLLGTNPANAQHDATWKGSGQPGSNHGFSRRIIHATDYARDLRAYVQKPVDGSQKPNPAAVKEIVVELGRNLEAGKKHLVDMKKAAGDDKVTLVAIEKLEDRLTAAFELQETAHACCVKDFDQDKAAKCCDDLSHELEHITKDHDALMKTLTAKKPATTKTPRNQK